MPNQSVCGWPFQGCPGSRSSHAQLLLQNMLLGLLPASQKRPSTQISSSYFTLQPYRWRQANAPGYAPDVQDGPVENMRKKLPSPLQPWQDPACGNCGRDHHSRLDLSCTAKKSNLPDGKILASTTRAAPSTAPSGMVNTTSRGRPGCQELCHSLAPTHAQTAGPAFQPA